MNKSQCTAEQMVQSILASKPDRTDRILSLRVKYQYEENNEHVKMSILELSSVINKVL